MRYSDYEQRQMDSAYSSHMDSVERDLRKKLPCKNDGFAEVAQDGSCLRCGAIQGETCRVSQGKET